MTRLITLLLVLAMPLVNSALAQECAGGVGDETCCGDLDHSGSVTQADLDIANDEYGCTGCCTADVNWDGVVDEVDIGIIEDEMVENGGEPCTGKRPVPLRVWDPNCYDGNCDPNCQAAKGCLPIDGGTQARTVGVADANGDGWPDAMTWATVSSSIRRRLYRNNGINPADPNSKLAWTLVCLDPNTTHSGGYGHHLGDYNGDGYPEIVTSRSSPFAFLVNHGDPNSTIACFISARVCLGLPENIPETETLIWINLDGDDDVDLFVPAYEGEPIGPSDPIGNRLLLNLDPNTDGDCPGAPPTFYAIDPNWAIPAGLQDYGPDPNSDYRDPEGCQAIDYDGDGDPDLFFSSRIWQNVTSAGNVPDFLRLDPNDTGLAAHGNPEEGLLLADFNMDGVLDFLRVNSSSSARLAFGRGDGTFEESVSFGGFGYGLSSADWDNDGDIDFTVGGNFFRNMLVEGLVGPYAGNLWQRIRCLDDGDYVPIEFACPSWLDLELDGDLDVARGAWTVGASDAKFERNYLYHGQCPDCEPKRRYVNVRPVQAAPANGPNGMREYSENEFGAKVEIVLRNDPITAMAHRRRINFTCTGSGYLNQNEYPLHFGLPPDPDPNDPIEDLHFDVYVDFVTRRNENWRVDWTVNEQLADINLADLYADCNDITTWGRPITVYRDGRARFRGADPNVAPSDPNIARLYTLGGPLTLPSQGTSLPGLATGNVFAGVRFNKEPNSPELRIREVIVDGQLDQTTPGCAYNIVLLDVTDPNAIQEISGMKAYTFADNHRTFIHVPPPADPNNPDFILPANGAGTTTKYEVRVRVTKYRMNALPDPNGLSDDPGDPGVTLDKGLNTVNVLLATGSLCTQTMTLRNDTQTPVTVRLSRAGN